MARHDELRQRCAALVNGLAIPVPFDVETFCAQLGAERGRPIHLMPIDMPTGSPSGLLVSMDDGDYVLYERRTTPSHRTLIVLHEVGHSLLHDARRSCGNEHSDHQHAGGAVVAAPLLSVEAAQRLLPHLDPAMVQRTLGRTSYSDEEERAAELVASLVLERAMQLARLERWEAAAADAPVIDRVEISLRGGNSEHRTSLSWPKKQ